MSLAGLESRKGNAKSQGRKAAKILNCQKALCVFAP